MTDHKATLGYINAVGSFLPNDPVTNEQMETVLGYLDGKPSRVRPLVLDSCGIKLRHYAIDPRTGQATHTNAEMTAKAIECAANSLDVELSSFDLLASGTTTPDQLNPGHACMTQGELKAGPLEAVSFTGFCASAMAALRYAAMSVGSGMRRRAAVTGSELSSALARGSFWAGQKPDTDAVTLEPGSNLNQEFLRWIMADGAGCAIIEPSPRLQKASLRIDWIDGVSLAHKYPACMFHGAEKERRSGRLHGWLQEPTLQRAVERNYFCITQDVMLLRRDLVTAGVENALREIVERRQLRSNEYNWFLPHLSSYFFRQPLADAMDRIGFSIAPERWFTNLDKVGNLGSAAIFLILDEALKKGLFERNQKILCGIPESGRFTFYYMQLTVC
jgi:3-oxoacyl-[acyl-carrier-protein] synthase III